MNMIWVVVPAWILYDSGGYVMLALRDPVAYAALLEAEKSTGKGEAHGKSKRT